MFNFFAFKIELVLISQNIFNSEKGFLSRLCCIESGWFVKEHSKTFDNIVDIITEFKIVELDSTDLSYTSSSFEIGLGRLLFKAVSCSISSVNLLLNP